MYLKRTVAAFFSAMALFFTPAASGAATDETIDMRSRMWEESSGHVIIRDTSGGAKEITIAAEKLVPNSVFTVWFANEDVAGEKKEVGEGENSFRTDANGNAEFKAIVPAEQMEDWRKIVVGFHPEGDPSNLENVHLALSGDLNEAG